MDGVNGVGLQWFLAMVGTKMEVQCNGGGGV